MKVYAYLPTKVELPEAVQWNANGQQVILSVALADGRTVQLEVGSAGDICLRGWGNIPASVGNMDQIRFRALLQQQPATNCATCYNKLGTCNCRSIDGNTI